MINDYQHRQAAHCENGTTANLLRFNKLELSEPMIFGIGSGLFFSHMPFYIVNGLPVTSFRPYPGQIFNRVTRLLGIKIKRYRFTNPEKAMSVLDRLLSENIPVGMLVGVFYLPYFPPEYRFHFNAHNIVAIGKDEENRYLVSDPIMENIEKLTYDELRRVRFALGTYPPKGRMYIITGIPSEYDLKKAIIRGIRKNCRRMLEIPIPMFGIKGIRYLSKRMRKWPQKLGPKKAASNLGQVIRMLEEIGTGGAGFRFIYAAFLQEASKILQMQELNELSKEMTFAGDKWREFAWLAGKNFKNRAKPEQSYSYLADMLLAIADHEEKIFLQLKKLFK